MTFTLGNLSGLTSRTGEYSLAVTPFVGKVIDDDAGNLLAAASGDTWVHSLPAWLAAGSAATWDTATKALTITGAATIVADPGADSPVITANGAAAVLTINPSSGRAVHVGGLTLTGGATATLTSVASAAAATAVTLNSSTSPAVRGGGGKLNGKPRAKSTSLVATASAVRTAANSRVLVVMGNTFEIDADSTLDLTDNNLILDYAGDAEPRRRCRGAWCGPASTAATGSATASPAAPPTPTGASRSGVADNARLADPVQQHPPVRRARRSTRRRCW